jgi:hypothetical protein
MPDFDPTNPLRDFDGGSPMNALPAAEIRRRGDRLRRRNNALAGAGGALAVAALIGIPVAINANNTPAEIQPAPPAPSPTETESQTTAPVDWLTTIPADFPITEGMVTGGGQAFEGGVDAFSICDFGYPTSRGTADTQTWVYSDDGESSATRVIQLWSDDEAARASVQALEQAVQDCPAQPTPGGEDIIESKLVDFRTGGDVSTTFIQQIVADDGLVSQLSVVEVTVVGNAVLVDWSYGSAAGDDVVDFVTQRLAELSAETRAAMCVFAADPCAGPEDPNGADG